MTAITSTDTKALALGVQKGSFRSIARALTVIENFSEIGEQLVDSLHCKTGNCLIFGVTGPPGSGKSSLVDGLIKMERNEGRRVAVVAVDPSSPFSGGALLGDRLRMQSHANDPGVFIRSMASRGHLGGLSNATFDAVKIFDAAGFETVIIETVGVGQSEIEVVEVSDAVLLVLAPGMGDDIQAMKAGIMEIGDFFVVNKKDKDGAEKLKTEIEYVLRLKEETHEKSFENVFMVSAKFGEGIDVLHRAIKNFIADMVKSGKFHERRKQKTRKEIERIIQTKITESITRKSDLILKIENAVLRIHEREISPYEFVRNEIKI
ncbi:methylmalonyl Co-A mutase-associated GTPase MeaB [candidate division WOR-3 bacterium]|nr:methylmalonyl Co-A mutase-associated GTPase MeaB [candidate division WOR-3 bacterium]